eukprot:4218939-Amphidinium_carterae.1
MWQHVLGRGGRHLAVTTLAAPAVATLLPSKRLVLCSSPEPGCPTARVVQTTSPTPSDIDIAQSVALTPVKEVFCRTFGLAESDVNSYGPYKGKLDMAVYERLKGQPNGYYV